MDNPLSCPLLPAGASSPLVSDDFGGMLQQQREKALLDLVARMSGSL